MFFTLGLSATATSFLGFKVTEYASAAYKSDNNVTKLSLIAFKTSDGMSAANCTFNWSTSVIYSAASGSNPINSDLTYISNCHDRATTDNYYNGSTTTSTPFTTSTATFDQFLKFDAINIYYNNTLYYSINSTNAAAVGFTPATFFAGQTSPYVWSTNFAAVTTLISGTESLSTVKAKLYIAKF